MFHQNIRIYLFIKPYTCGVGRWFACLPVYKTEDCIDHRGFYFRRCSHWIPSGLIILIIQIMTFFHFQISQNYLHSIKIIKGKFRAVHRFKLFLEYIFSQGQNLAKFQKDNVQNIRSRWMMYEQEDKDLEIQK